MTKVSPLTKRKPILIFLSLLGALVLAAVALAPKAARAEGGPKHLFYTLGGPNPDAEELWAIQVSGSKITTTEIGAQSGEGCASLAMSPLTGKLYSMCSVDPSTFPLGDMRLVTIDTNSGLATPIPSGSVNQLGVMARPSLPMARCTRLGAVSPIRLLPSGPPTVTPVLQVSTHFTQSM
jgi:hypothetical protein